MKVLISAYSCEPGRGSESGVGWNLVRELSEDHELWVITRRGNQPAIEADGGSWTRRVRWEYIDPPRSMAFWKRGARGFQCYYAWWQWLAFRHGRKLHSVEKFDLTHHLTVGSYLPATRWWKLAIPHIAGPLGGGDLCPPALLPGLSPALRAKEEFRRGWRALAERLPTWRRAYQRTAACIAGTPETARRLEAIGARQVTVLPQSGIGGDEIGAFLARAARAQPRSPAPSDHPRPLRMICASRLIGWKAVDLALETVAELKRRGLPTTLDILHSGPELARLRARAAQLGIADEVNFRGRLGSLEHVYEAVAAADLLIHPALHEAFGQICLEALALGTPVVCLDHAGPGMIVTPATGFAVEPGDRAHTITRLADAAERVSQMPAEEMHVLRQRARERALAEFSWRGLARKISAIYLRTAREPASVRPAQAAAEPSPRQG